MTRVHAVVFDLDGTLIDSRADIVASVGEALRAHGYPPLDGQTVARFVGDGARRLIARCLGQEPEHPSVDPVLASFVAHYSEHACERTTLVEGAVETLDALSGLPLALFTNKPRSVTEKILAALGIASRWSSVIAGGDIAAQKPAPDGLIAIAQRLGLETAELVMVGDGPQDIECGRRAGARTVGFDGGLFVPRSVLDASHPDVIVKRLPEVVECVAEWRS
jgi:phosphoglycolate phosphatase